MTTERFRYDSALEKVYDDDTYNGETIKSYGVFECCELLNEQQAIIDKQELRLQRLEELLELSENLNKSYKEKLIDMNLKMVSGDE